MTLLKAIGEALKTVLQWVAMAFGALYNWVTVSEWNVLFVSLAIIGLIIGVPFFKRRK